MSGAINQYVISARCCKIQDSTLHRMPITSYNKIPRVSFLIDNQKNVATISCLDDTRSELNTGNLALHLHIRKCIPSAVADFEDLHGSNPFESIKLCGTLLDSSDDDSTKHGNMSVVIRYHTPYSTIGGTKVLLWVLLGVGVSVDIIIGIPFIHELSMKFRLIFTRQYLTHEIKTSLPVKYKETVLTIVDSVPDNTFGDSVGATPEIRNPTVTLGTSSVVSDTLRSLLQSVASNG